jgi:hypothetical protein
LNHFQYIILICCIRYSFILLFNYSRNLPSSLLRVERVLTAGLASSSGFASISFSTVVILLVSIQIYEMFGAQRRLRSIEEHRAENKRQSCCVGFPILLYSIRSFGFSHILFHHRLGKTKALLLMQYQGHFSSAMRHFTLPVSNYYSEREGQPKSTQYLVMNGGGSFQLSHT